MVRLRHAFGFEILVLGAIGGEIPVDFSAREQEDFVGRSRGGAGAGAGVAVTLVIGLLRNGLHLGPKIGRHEAPKVTGIETTAELRLLPAADVGERGVHSLSAHNRVGCLERKTGFARTVGEVIMVDADDAVLERLAVRQLHRKLGAGIHRGLRLGVCRRGLALRRDVLGYGLLLIERPVLRVLGDSRLDGRGTGPGGASTGRAAALYAAGRPAVHRVADQVELVTDGPGHAGSREHDHQADNRDDQDVLDD